MGIEAFGSPITDQAIIPPFKTISGFTPKNAGFHKTRSANLPASTDPTWPAIPCEIAGLMVNFDT